MKLGILATHPIQYHAPLFRELAGREGVDLTVYFAHRPTPAEQGEGFGVAFAWDVDLLSGYQHHFLANVARHPAQGFGGYDTPEIAAIIARENFDVFIIHGWNNRSCWQAFLACWRTGTRLAVRSDSQLPQGRMSAARRLKQAAKRLLYPHFIRRFDLCLPYGQRSAEYFRHYGGRRIAIAPHFVDNDWFASQAALLAPRRAELRRQWGIPEDAYCFLFCGKFIAKKRPLDLLQALDLLCREPLAPGAPHLLMVGSGELLDQCRSYAAARNLPVTFAGFLNQGEITQAYVAADCLVLPSESETWGLVVNEALACGLPVIVSDACGCVPDLIEPGGAGYAYPCKEVAALAGRMRQMENVISPGACGDAIAKQLEKFSAATAATAILKAVDRIKNG